MSSILSVKIARGRFCRAAPCMSVCTRFEAIGAYVSPAQHSAGGRLHFDYRSIRLFLEVDYMEKKRFSYRGKLRLSLMIGRCRHQTAGAFQPHCCFVAGEIHRRSSVRSSVL